MGSDVHSDVQGRQGGQELHPAAEIERLLAEVESLPDLQARALAEELVRALLALYGEGLRRIVELLAAVDGSQTPAASSGGRLLDLLARDELVAALLLLHDVHPIPLRERLEQALAELRPVVRGHGGDLVLLGVADGVASLRLSGSCHGCAASLQYLRQRIEEAVYRVAPDLNGLEIEGIAGAEGGTVGATPSRSRTPAPVVFVPRRRGSSPAAIAAQESGTRVREG
ncbi:NifU family protein [Thermogemmatispora onikobensis]|uniref:NifU family protein n=1 Tax=Thermogemmatispora onikobensis TaxID=732234 RepID=UPI00085334A7|nr:NifU family protein [Thermogemmatispora onikobensis]